MLVHWGEGVVRLAVDDDGAGFDPGVGRNGTRPADAGLGLASIRDRLASMGGRFAIDSLPGRGARVMLELPLRPDAATNEEPDHAAAARTAG